MINDTYTLGFVEPKEKHLEILNKYFGHSQFRPMQWEIIRKIIEDKCDLCVVMATGYGKSLCFQYPAVYTGGVVIVVSPLISLMHDQVLALDVANIPACLLGSAQKNKSAVIQGILNNEYRLVYVTPEFCSGDYGSSMLNKFSDQVNVVLVAIDEAHCVSQWGFDFRTSYRKLGVLKDIFPKVPLLTVTATATIKVCRDICSSLKLSNPQIIRTDFDRPNLFLGVSLKTTSIFDDLKRFLKRSGLMFSFGGPTIIYCPTKKAAETVCDVLNENGVRCAVYHAELAMKKRTEVHDKFVKDQIQVIAATIAFGMGIDKPDVRLVIHYGAPKDIESYYQEIGRAGRDGLPSVCHVFYSSGDFRVNEHFISHLTGQYREHRVMLSKIMSRYLETRNCRRDLIISYFDPGKTAIKPEGVKYRNNCCDNCTRLLSNKQSPYETLINDYDLRNDALLLLRAVSVFDGRRGLTIPILLLRGSSTQRLPAEYYKHKLFGVGKNKSEAWWKAIGRLLTTEELIAQQGSFNKFSKSFFNVATVKITSLGWNFILNPECFGIKLTPSNELMSLAKTEPSMLRRTSIPVRQQSKELHGKDGASGQIDVQRSVSSKPVKTPLSKEESELMYELYYGLMTLRTDMASKYGCMPYMIANNRMLMDLARHRPKSKEELVKIEGFSQNKVEKFGDEIIEKMTELIENFKSKQNRKSHPDNEKDHSIELPSESFADETIWGEEDDSFLMTTPFEVLQDFQYNNDSTNKVPITGDDNTKDNTLINNDDGKGQDELWPDLDLSNIDENFDNIPVDNCKNTVKPSTSTTCDHAQSLATSSSHKKTVSNCFTTFSSKRKTLEFEDSDESDSSGHKDTDKSEFVTSPRSKKTESKSTSPVKPSSVISEKPLPDWIYKPEHKILLNKKMKKNTLFKM